MNLHKPLLLASARTEDLSMVPTKEFFKPVLVVTAPLSRDNALLLGCDYLFDASGNPHHFEGTHKLEGDLSGAHIALAGSLASPVELKTEQVAHFGVFREEKKGMKVRLRAHLPELPEGDLVNLFRFLSTLNKEGYTLTVTDAQGSLITVPLDSKQEAPADPAHVWAQPDHQGVYAHDRCTIRPFTAGKKLKAEILTIQVADDRYLYGWTLAVHFKSFVTDIGRLPNDCDLDSVPLHTSTVAAGVAAAGLKLEAKKIITANDPEIKIVADLEDFVNDVLDQGDAQ